MNSRTTRILSAISIILQSLVIVLAVMIIKFQKSLVPVFMGYHTETSRLVVPASLYIFIASLLIYIAFFYICNNIENDNGKTLAIILIALNILSSIVSVVIGFFHTYYYSKMGVEYVAMYSAVSTLISYAYTVFGVPAAPIFYFAAGRYTIEKEN